MNRAKQLVDAKFGINRDLTDEELKNKKIDLFDEIVCKNFLALGFCPNFYLSGYLPLRQTCAKIHDPNFHLQFLKLPFTSQKYTQSLVLKNLNFLTSNMDKKIKFSINNLNSSRSKAKALEQQSLLSQAKSKLHKLSNSLKSENFEDFTNLALKVKEMNELSNFINGKNSNFSKSAKDFISYLNNEKNVNYESIPRKEKIKEIVLRKTEINSQNINKEESDLVNVPQASICKICGAFILQNDTEQRALSHLTGKLHTAFFGIREAKKKLEGMGIKGENVREQNYGQEKTQRKRFRGNFDNIHYRRK